MHTYRELFRAPGYGPLFAAVSCRVAGEVVAGLALATVVFDRTGSPFLAAMGMFGPSLGQVLGATTLLSAGDRLAPRRALAAVALLHAAVAVLLALSGGTVVLALTVVPALGAVAAVAGAVQWGLVTDLLPRDGYLLGRSVLNMGVGAVQVLGGAAGAALLVAASPRAVLLAAAALHGAGAAALLLGLDRRPARVAGRPSVRETWRVDRRLLADPAVRRLYLALWVPNGLVVGAEALFVPYAGDAAGALMAAAALGMLAGDAAVGRLVPERWRAGLVTPLRVLLAAPYLLFALRPGPVAGMALVAVASSGFAAALLLQDRLLALTPAGVHGQALGLHGAGTRALQAGGAAVAGGLAEAVPPAAAMAVMAALSLAVTAALTPGLRRDRAAGAVRPGAAG